MQTEMYYEELETVVGKQCAYNIVIKQISYYKFSMYCQCLTSYFFFFSQYCGTCSTKKYSKCYDDIGIIAISYGDSGIVGKFFEYNFFWEKERKDEEDKVDC